MRLYGTEAPGQGPSFQEPKTGLTLERRAFYFAYIRFISDTIIREVQNYFGTDPGVPTERRWVGTTQPISDGTTCIVSDPESPVWISSEWADVLDRYPSILLSDVSLDINDLWLGQKMGGLYVPNPQFKESTADKYTDDIPRLVPEFLEVGERIGGKLEANITIKIRGGSKVERDEITDLVLLGFLSPIRRKLYRANLNWLPNRGKISGEGVEDKTSTRKIHTRSFIFGLQTEWYEDFYYKAVTVEDVRFISTVSNPSST